MTGLAGPRGRVDSETHARLRPVLSDSARRRGLRGAVDADHHPKRAPRLPSLRRDPRRGTRASPEHPLPTPPPLERDGVVACTRHGRATSYELTTMGQELFDLC